MKRLMAILIISLLASSIVFAQENKGGTEANKPDDAGKPKDAGQMQPDAVTAGKNIEAEEGMPKGLSVALTRVKNENASQRLQQNMEAFRERYQERFQNMEGVEIDNVDEETGAVKIKAKEPVKYFGFINGKATKRFNINAEGKIDEKPPWYRFMYKEASAE